MSTEGRLIGTSRLSPAALRSRFRGCLLGGACGDALGAPVEFMSREKILRIYGPGGIEAFDTAYGRVGAITDDTQMTLFTAEGLLRGWVRGSLNGITSYEDTTSAAYLRWLLTQGEINPLLPRSLASGWLVEQIGFSARRGPGRTCLAALHAMTALGAPARNDSKGCGGVMRLAPVGLFAARLPQGSSPEGLPPSETFQLGVRLAALTHGHPSGWLPAGVLAVLVQGLVAGVPLAQALVVAKACLRRAPDHAETLDAILRAEDLAASDLAPSKRENGRAIAKLGQGWVGEEALAIALYCALVAPGFREGVVLAVNHDGDSDSTGAIAGNLLGALWGAKEIPRAWLARLELKDVITEMADDLLAFPGWEISQGAETEKGAAITRKYPGL
ncbi:ADP-ribosylglycohydrolase family protein [Bradyrhizobium prioriisuperbiae]|uniref:ADP-ribosylglycohydrolase family protein n=1 Tax=Bradyrhizobium prioriisuperbiae TaxID=2854389 RepID=UPI0028EDBF3B|nr:ADP-ribosylglycohydrolase family protein [Bradyrhizobium prioritasuperba]